MNSVLVEVSEDAPGHETGEKDAVLLSVSGQRAHKRLGRGYYGFRVAHEGLKM